MRTLNLGIVAHVDAGKTSLTERLLHAAGIIDELGSVDHGSTQTDQLALERQRGITIRSAVVSFEIDDVTVNLIDTPGHPDFIAEVERVLGVLDGAVLVLSGVEGVQAQTRVLFRTLQRLGIPTLLFVNKIDRRGAGDDAVLDAIAAKLTRNVVAMTQVRDVGTHAASVRAYDGSDGAHSERLAELLADHDDQLLVAYLDDTAVAYRDLRRQLVRQTGRALVHPVFFGSAITGAGVDELIAALTELLPTDAEDPQRELSGTVFKIERDGAGNRLAYVRLFSGTLRTRDRLRSGTDERKITGIETFERGCQVPTGQLQAGRIGLVRGLGDVRVGDAVGAPHPGASGHHFAPPSLEAIVDPCRSEDRGALLAALTELVEQDPLIDLRQDDVRQEIHVSLYGEVQKEVIQATLASDYGLEVTFRETTTICVERPAGIGEAVEHAPSDGRSPEQPFLATVGLRVEPAPAGSGVCYRRASSVLGTMPAAFFTAVEETVLQALQQGLNGWQVIDCTVTLTHTGYWPRQSASHQGFDRAISSTGSDFRSLTPLVLMAALGRARTVVCEPIHRFELEVPDDVLGVVVPAMSRLQAVPLTTVVDGATAIVHGDVPAARIHELQRQVPALTRGEGILVTDFDRYEPVRGEPPSRERTDHDPLHREEYLLRLQGRIGVGR